ncbi:MAG: hypothetical protein QOE70_4883 [Chthoniobacter sp.]|jgi:hypothetical protein|nr:hypothetical protein [Chthoniobacter sp.]
MRTLILAVVMSAVVLQCARSEEKNGLQVTVGKKTIDRNDRRTGTYSYSTDRIDRTQALKVTIKNISFKEMPEGEVKWTVLVKKYYGGSTEGYTGKQPVKALKPAEMVELVLGSAEIRGWNDSTGQVKDKIEHQVIVTQGSKEMVRAESTPGFDAIAERASFTAPAAGQRPQP